MIELKLTGKCEGCPAIDPIFSKLYANGVVAEIAATCAKEAQCNHLESYLAKQAASYSRPGDAGSST